MISLFNLGVVRGNISLADARRNMELILLAFADDTSDNIAVDVKGPILLAPFNGEDTLDGGASGFNLSRAIKCLTFDYGASFATHPAAGTNINLVNVQIEASDKAFLFETNDAATKVNVTELYNSIVSVCPHAA